MTNTINTNANKIIFRVAIVTICINIALATLAIVSSVVFGSLVLRAEGINHFSDVLSTVVLMIGVTFAAKEPDRNHPYGHERIECITAIILSFSLAYVGISLGQSSITSLASGGYKDSSAIGTLAFVAPIVAVVSKESMFWYTMRSAKKIGSATLRADAWHHRADVMSSLAALVGVVGSVLGYPIFDPIATLVVCVLVLKTAIDIFREAVSKITDTACSDSKQQEIRQTICSCRHVKGIELLKTRRFGERLYVDAEIMLDSSLTFELAHSVSECVHGKIESGFADVKHCTVHASPLNTDGDRFECVECSGECRKQCNVCNYE